MKQIVIFILILGAALFLFQPGLVAQCAMCKGSVETATYAGDDIGLAVNHGILYLLSLPFVLAGFVGFLWFQAKKNQKNEKDEKDQENEDNEEEENKSK